MTRHPATARRLLVAAPELSDPNFARTVVFMVEHTDDGALGVVLNRPTSTDVDAVLPAWASVAAAPATVFVGGPVSLTDAVIGLGRVLGFDEPDGWQRLLGSIGTLDLAADPLLVRPPVEAVRVFAGYAGWAAGQLEDELDAGGWHVVDAEPADLLTESPATLWRAVLRRQGGELAVAANHAADPSVN